MFVLKVGLDLDFGDISQQIKAIKQQTETLHGRKGLVQNSRSENWGSHLLDKC